MYLIFGFVMLWLIFFFGLLMFILIFFQVYPCNYQGSWKEHGCHCCGYGENWKRLHSISKRTGLNQSSLLSLSLPEHPPISVSMCQSVFFLQRIRQPYHGMVETSFRLFHHLRKFDNVGVGVNVRCRLGPLFFQNWPDKSSTEMVGSLDDLVMIMCLFSC